MTTYYFLGHDVIHQDDSGDPLLFRIHSHLINIFGSFVFQGITELVHLGCKKMVIIGCNPR